ncbi:MAG TPA: MFS transporter [Solirubrobacteraceae bacterium]|jgi:EmrB/QacA subfamily drug resistance transporter|nr:MFS transporter [Solirubrobacteraceae bacterium]
MPATTSTNRRWWTLAAVVTATFMLLLDITVVNTALPKLEGSLHASFTDLQWVIDVYSLALATVVLTAGSLADRLGRKRSFLAGLVVFSAASLACALAPSAAFLIGARAVQGIGGAIMFALSLALVAQEFPVGRERGTAMSIYGATIGVAVATGPLVGGALTQSLGWQSVFYLNVPIGLAAIAITATRVSESRDPNAAGADWPGVSTFTAGLFMLVFALLRGNALGWGSAQIVALLAGAVATLGAFVLVERTAANPMLPLELFRNRAFTGVQIAAFAISASLFALFLYLTLYLQQYLGNSPLGAGERYLPLSVVTFVIAGLSAWWVSRVAARAQLGAGLVLAGLGMILMSDLHAGDTWTALLPGLIVAGIGVGVVNTVIADVALSVVPKERSGMAAGINDTFRQVGVAVGVAAWGALFTARGAAKAVAQAPAAAGHGRQLIEAVSGGRLHQAVAALPVGVRGAVAHAARAGFLSGLNEILLLGGSLAVLGGIAAALLVREHEIEREVVETPAPTVVGMTA